MPAGRTLLVALLGLWLFGIATGVTGYGPAAYAQTPADAPDVEIVREHLLFTRGFGGVQVLHLVDLQNVGPREASAVPLSVPEGVQWPAVPDELVLEEGRVVDSRPLAVGEGRRYALEYEIPWQRLPMAVKRPVLYPTRELLLWAQADELELRGVNLQFSGRQQIEDVELDMYVMLGLQPHPAWQIVLDSAHSRADRLPVLTPAGQRSDPVDILRTHPLPRLLLGTLLVAGAIGVVRRLAARRIPVQSSPAVEGGASGSTGGARRAGGSSSEAADLSSTRRAASASVVPRSTTEPAVRDVFDGHREIARLKEEIVRLDVAYDSGELDEDVYKARRDELKQRVLALMTADKERGAPGGERP